MRHVRCKGGCGRTKGAHTAANKGDREAVYTSESPWTCDDCASRIERKKANLPEKKEPTFRLVPRKTPKPPPKDKAPVAPPEGEALPPVAEGKPVVDQGGSSEATASA